MGALKRELAYTPKEVAELPGVSKGTVYNFVRRGVLPAFRMGGRLLISRQAVDEMALRMRESLSPAPSFRGYSLWDVLLLQVEAIASELDALRATRIVVTVDRTNVLDRPWRPGSPEELRTLLVELADCCPSPKEVEICALGDDPTRQKQVARISRSYEEAACMRTPMIRGRPRLTGEDAKGLEMLMDRFGPRLA